MPAVHAVTRQVTALVYPYSLCKLLRSALIQAKQPQLVWQGLYYLLHLPRDLQDCPRSSALPGPPKSAFSGEALEFMRCLLQNACL